MINTEAIISRARSLLGAGDAAQAQAVLESLCREQPTAAEAWFLLGAAYHLGGHLPQASTAFEQAFRLDPQHVQALNARASMLSLLGHGEAALAAYEQAHVLAPDDVRIVVNAAIVLEQLGRMPQALQRYTQALQLDADCLPAWLNRCALNMRMGRNAEALADAERAIAVDPHGVDAHYNRAESLLALDRYEDALLAAGKVAALAPAHVGGQMCRALAFSCLGQIEEARAAFRHARSLDPDAFGEILQAVWRAAPGGRGGWECGADGLPDPRAIYLVRGMARLARCDWRGRDTFIARFEALVRDGVARADPVCEWSLPFSTLFLPLAPDVVHGVIAAVERRVARTAPPRLPPASVRRDAGQPLRMGVLSASFRRHPSAFLNAPILHRYDRKRVEAIAYVLNPLDGSPEASWLAAGCMAVRPCHGLRDEEVAQRIRGDGIHILLDESGAYDMSRPEILCLRPAPINVAYMSALLPSTSDWLDYRVLDWETAQGSEGEFRSESVVVLPRTHFTYGTGPVELAATPTRAAMGLPERGVVLCCFNGAYKFDPVMFRIWMRILAQAPAAVLWLLGEREVERNLRAEAHAHGIDPQRLVFAPRVNFEAHLARKRLADLFLDTLPCNAHTTAAEALYCGVPVLTLPGDTAAGRCAAGIVRSVGLSDLVVSTHAEYEALALKLVTDGVALAAVKARLQAARTTSPLWDADDLARYLERAFDIMWQRYAEGRKPESFEVPLA